MSTTEAVQIAVECRNRLGEGIIWSVRREAVCWVDIESNKFWFYYPARNETHTIELSEAICSYGPTPGSDHLAATETGIAIFTPETEEVRYVEQLVPDAEHSEGVRLNDGRCDRNGRFIVGGMDPRGAKRGKLFSVTSHGGIPSARVILDGIGCANSTCFSLDGKTMYFSDTPEHLIWAFDYDTKTGNPSNRRVFVDLHDQPGGPDGSTIDAEGFLWNAQWGGSRVVRYNPRGEVDRTIELPCRYPTCPAFGGDALDTLYITSARREPSGSTPAPSAADGALLCVKPGVRGVAESTFAL